MLNIPNPSNEMDELVGSIILSNVDGNFDDIIKQDNRWEIILNLSTLASGIWAWYPFDKRSNVLHIGAGFGNITEKLARVCGNIIAQEKDLYRAYCLRKRLENLNNVTVVNDLAPLNDKFDYIIYAVDKTIDNEYITSLKGKLNSNGKLLLLIPNKLGIKYFCGEPNSITGRPFDGITDTLDKSIGMTKQEIKDMLEQLGLVNIKFYYPFPNHEVPQMIYSDDYQPGEELKERLRTVILNKNNRVLDEAELAKIFAKNNLLLEFANSFIVECGDSEATNVLYAALSTERSRENAFITVINKDSVEKIALFDEGKQGLYNLHNNAVELEKRKVPVLSMQLKDDRVVMKRIKQNTLSEHIRKLVKHKETIKVIECIDKIYEYILQSSEKSEENSLKEYAPYEEWGPILKKAYIEMIPVNCFMLEEDLLFFDQEFSQINYPAKFVLYRAINDIYMFIPEINNLIPLEEMKKRYGLNKLWKYMQKADEPFHIKLRQHELYNHFNYWTENNKIAMNENRKLLSMNNKDIENIYEPHLELKGKDIILFGSGKFCDKYLEKYMETYPPLFIVDNNKEKWGTSKNGIEIKNPSDIKSLAYGSYRIIIAVSNYLDIINQIEEMGINKENYRVFNPKIDGILANKIINTTTDEKYNIGYVTGVFDLFHIGHLNLLKKCKERCHYLIAGVVNDELVREDKKKEPYIPFEERIEIVKQCKYVDRVIEIDRHNTDKIDAWKELQYGCLFSGDDHKNDPYWLILQSQLQALGSNLEFFPYTQGTSSSILQKVLAKELK